MEVYGVPEYKVSTCMGMTIRFPIVIGLHQGSVPSSYLFDLVMDVLVEDGKMEAQWSMLFKDNIVFCEPTLEQLE